ncbi:cytochrome P450 [Polyangium jinanense]|uniref:Cytochrome P450 n=1 Tax=Polyangium jinanense TaxID=2829994 RepID=A0A9X4ASV6_9BACT|nr:cytochrome P450 [Polyangium jinanense]MDC3955291.1 cytochrome P450 [Polyangium jinanense]MDC3981592.1 cytochrome P450 [Polyangium jinanense]
MKTAYPPGPKGMPLLGNVLQIRKNKLAFMLHAARTHGDIAHFRLGPIDAYLLNHPDHIRDVLIERADVLPKDRLQNKIISPFFGNGMLISNGEEHHRQRRMAQPAFHPRRLDSYARIFVEQALQGMAGWRSGDEYAIDAEMLKMTIQNVCLALFNADATDIVARAAAAMTSIIELLSTEFDLAIPIPMWLPTQRNRRKREAIRELDSIVMKFVADWRRSGQDRGDLLSMLMLAHGEARGGVTHDELRDHLITMFSAGHETTAFTLVWAWILLSQHPDVEAELWTELDRVLGGRPPTAEDLPQLVYTTMIVKETLRLYPAGWLLSPREPHEDITLGGYTIPKGSMIFISPYVLHRDGRFFPEPERFRPERFRPGADKHIARGTYIPFGIGPRVCIGGAFATTEAVLTLATVAQRYRVSLLPGQSLAPRGNLALRPPPGVKVRVIARKTVAAAA